MPTPVLLLAGNAGPMTGRGNNTWLLDGAEPTLVDAGVGDAAHVEAVAAALGGRPLARVLITHGHPDHASGVPALRARWPAIEARKRRLPGETGFRDLHDGEIVRAGGAELRVVFTPGHAPDHVCFWNAASRDLFAGDMVVLGGSVMIAGGRGGSVRAYLESLDRMAELEPARIFPGHGDVVEHPLDLLAQYREHRRMREDQVRQCLASGVTTVDAMVAMIYPNIAGPTAGRARDDRGAPRETEGRWMAMSCRPGSPRRRRRRWQPFGGSCSACWSSASWAPPPNWSCSGTMTAPGS